MSMQAASLEVLEKANVPAQQARAIVQAIEIEMGAAQNTLATKQDLVEHRHATKQDLTGLRGDLRVEIHESAKDLLRHMYTAILAQTAVLLTASYFMATHLKP
jgi:hypothetical protein